MVVKRQKNPLAEMVTRLRYTDSAYTAVLDTQWSQLLGTVRNVSPMLCSTLCSFAGTDLLAFSSAWPSQSLSRSVRKDPKCSIEWTSPLAILLEREGRGRALCQVCTPGCGGAHAPLVPGPGQPEPSGCGHRESLLRASFGPEAPLISSKKLKTLV